MNISAQAASSAEAELLSFKCRISEAIVNKLKATYDIFENSESFVNSLINFAVVFKASILIAFKLRMCPTVKLCTQSGMFLIPSRTLMVGLSHSGSFPVCMNAKSIFMVGIDLCAKL